MFDSVKGLAIAAVIAGLAPAAAVAAEPGMPSPADVVAEGGVTPVARAGTPLAARSAISRSELHGKLKAELRSVGGGSGAWVSDFRAPRDKVLFSNSAARKRILASVSKLFPTAAFLDRFGPDRRLTTAVWARGQRTGPDGRVVKGGLALVGDGDPTLGEAELQRLARQVRRSGIRNVRGPLLVDDTIFDRKRFVPMPGISGGPWLSPMSGLSYNQGYDGGRFAKRPEKVAARKFVKLLRNKGVRFGGKILVRGTPVKLRARPAVATARSAGASRLIERSNTPSSNFDAEMITKRLAAGAKNKGTTKRGVARTRRFARSVGSDVKLVNGSGLSRTNVASPKDVGRLLVHMAKDARLRGAYRGSLAVAGRSGTLASRMRGTAAEGRCQAKTGTIDGVSALSGYCAAGAGRIVFSILMNGVNVDAARRAQDRMVAAIARYR